MEIIETRRFFSNQSGRLYFRTSDLARATVFNPTPSLGKMRIWPRGTVMIMEVYAGKGGTMGGAEPVEVTVMAKVDHRGRSSPPFSYPVDWSYGRFTSEGEPFLLPGQVQECHRCHSIAFHFTGDLVFSQFP